MHVNKNKNEIYKQMVLQHLKFILFINESSPTMKLDFFNKHMIIRQVYINMPFSIYSEQNRKRTCVTLCTTTSSTTIQSIFSPLFPSPLSFSFSLFSRNAQRRSLAYLGRAPPIKASSLNILILPRQHERRQRRRNGIRKSRGAKFGLSASDDLYTRWIYREQFNSAGKNAEGNCAR